MEARIEAEATRGESVDRFEVLDSFARPDKAVASLGVSLENLMNIDVANGIDGWSEISANTCASYIRDRIEQTVGTCAIGDIEGGLGWQMNTCGTLDIQHPFGYQLDRLSSTKNREQNPNSDYACVEPVPTYIEQLSRADRICNDPHPCTHVPTMGGADVDAELCSSFLFRSGSLSALSELDSNATNETPPKPIVD